MPPTSSPPERQSYSIQSMFGAISSRYDLANHLLSGGLDFLWRRHAAHLVGNWKPGKILDLATGSGDLALKLRSVCRQTMVVGADFCFPMLRMAQSKGLSGLVAANGLHLPFADGAFDVVTVAFGLRNMESWTRALSEMRRVLRHDGHLVILDFALPKAPLRWVYRPYLHHILPRLAVLLTGRKAAYEYLGASIEQFPQGSAMCMLLESNGFRSAGYQPLSGGIVALYTAMKPAATG